MTIPPGRSWKTLRWCQPTERGTSSGRATMRVVSRGNGSRGGPATARPSASYGESSYNPGDENPPRVSDALRGIRRARKNTGRGEAEQRGDGKKNWNLELPPRESEVRRAVCLGGGVALRVRLRAWW
jgi:hypothetical protein